MAPGPKRQRKDPKIPPPDEEGTESSGALVPAFGGPAIVPGTQAFRRDNIILYTVRGEPRQVLELMGRLDQEGVGEVVALISHQAAEDTAERNGQAIDVEPEEPDEQ